MYEQQQQQQQQSHSKQADMTHSYLFMLSGRNSTLVSTIDPPLELPDNKVFVLGFLNFVGYNSIPNVDETNNCFAIELEKNVSADKQKPVYIKEKRVITIPNGSYEIKDIETYLKDALSKEYRTTISLTANLNTLRCDLKTTFPIDFTAPNSIGRLLGFKPRILAGGKKHVSDHPINISKVTSLRVHCNLIANSYDNGKPVHVLHTFTTKVDPGFKINESPTNAIYLPINKKHINEIIVEIQDQDGKDVNFNDELITITLHLKEL